MPPEPSTAAPPVSDAAQTQALIQQIASEARSAGESLYSDADADADGDAPAAPAPKGKTSAGKAGKRGADASTAPPTEDNDHGNEDQEPPGTEDPDPGAEAAEEPAAQAGEIDPEAVRAALAAEGGTNLAALAQALGVELESLGLTQGAAAFVRLETKKSKQTLERAQALADKLQAQFGDQVAARKAASEGQLEPAIEYIEATFGMPWNELNRAVGQLLQGKPIGDLEGKRELRELKKREAERVEADRKKAEEAQASAKVTQAKNWIAGQIKSDKLASPELDAQLRAAGFPPIVDLVFEEMQAGYSKGLTDPKKALEKVRAKLTKQASVLRTAGLVPAGKAPPKPAPVSASRPRTDAQTGAAGNSRPMTDAELRQAVLKEAGLWRGPNSGAQQ